MLASDGLPIAYYSPATERCSVLNGVWGKKSPNDLTLRTVSLDEVENDLGLKGSILDRLDHVVGQVKGEESLVELEPIVNCANLRLRFVKSFVSQLVS